MEAFVPVANRGYFWAQEQYGQIDRRYPAMIDELVSDAEFFLSMPVVSGARRAVQQMRDDGLEVFFCSSPRPTAPATAAGKLEWVRENFGDYFLHRTILTQDKTLIHGDVLVDDKPAITGAKLHPSWRHILWDMPHNREVIGNLRMKRWASWRTFIRNGNQNGRH
jgi:5'-nucleotidase